ncbi:uncharacterized protein LOC126736864 isoform X1 [Anthonomus grandis grandis]|uniref:uncharacterized protein LOC126736864 isoform X1 n=1 Tax=Anthonomus grandis grandis TaxID=2921223 RepID=UPI00216615A3|nr:uncharacterized protein LOC126736864 isoform X1 [Anthonomus grandis grandis]
MKRKAKEDLKRKAKKRLLEDLRRKMEKFERFMESSTSSEYSDSTDSGSESDHSPGNDDEPQERVEKDLTLSVILGEDPKIIGEKGPPLCEALVNRWSSYLSEGLEKDIREALIEKYKTPDNGQFLEAPKLNPEIEISLSPAQIKRDQFSMSIQNKLGRALAAQGSVLNIILSKDATPHTIDDNTKTALADAAKLICEAHYLISYHRKHELYPFLNADVQKVAMKSQIDSLLFGENFQEKYKAAKEVKRTALDLKAGPSGNKQEKKDHLNYKRQSNRPRFKTEKYDRRKRARQPEWQTEKQPQWTRGKQSNQKQRWSGKYHN